ncbi:transposable element Tcb2 transposase [Trichonephila clavipes]|nr:transposable element Tcb2 transposase [Trichonephila clavipes]
MDDNARPHRTLAVEELLESEDVTRMDWPAYSPDLNPIEHVWDALGRHIAARLHHPENTQQLKQMLIEEWALLPQEKLHPLVLSMRRRCEATIALDPNAAPGKGPALEPPLIWEIKKFDTPLFKIKAKTILRLSSDLACKIFLLFPKMIQGRFLSIQDDNSLNTASKAKDLFAVEVVNLELRMSPRQWASYRVETSCRCVTN